MYLILTSSRRRSKFLVLVVVENQPIADTSTVVENQPIGRGQGDKIVRMANPDGVGGSRDIPYPIF